MAHTYNDGILPIGFWADQALSSYQYYCVAAASTEEYVKLAGGASNPYPMGITQDNNAASIGQAVAVKVLGYTKAVVDSRDVVGNACAGCTSSPTWWGLSSHRCPWARRSNSRLT